MSSTTFGNFAKISAGEGISDAGMALAFIAAMAIGGYSFYTVIKAWDLGKITFLHAILSLVCVAEFAGAFIAANPPARLSPATDGQNEGRGSQPDHMEAAVKRTSRK